MMAQFFEYSPDVEEAIKAKKPVLALESILITHGLPYPENLELARAIEIIAREHEVTPAIIAIIQGKVKIGLSPADLEVLVNDKSVIKAGTRDIPFVLSEQLTAATTVASTLFCAEYAGIKVFATGGIGGVHRGNNLDISADLIELARIPLGVVCSGSKAILDLAKTLEFLETFGVPIVGYRTDTFPGFYTAQTSFKLPGRVDNILRLAKLLKIHWQLGLSSSFLIANPIAEEDEIPANVIEPVILNALSQTEKKHIHGKELTPFLLNEIANATHGKSLQANIKLIKNNVKLGAMLAHALAYV